MKHTEIKRGNIYKAVSGTSIWVFKSSGNATGNLYKGALNLDSKEPCFYSGSLLNNNMSEYEISFASEEEKELLYKHIGERYEECMSYEIY